MKKIYLAVLSILLTVNLVYASNSAFNSSGIGGNGVSGATSLTGLSDVGSASLIAGKLLIADGTKYQSQALSGSCTINGSGVITCSGGGGSGASALTGLGDVTTDYTNGKMIIADGSKFNGVSLSGDIAITSTGATTIQANSVALTTDTTGNYVRSVSTTAPISGGSVSEGVDLTLGITASGIGAAELGSTTVNPGSYVLANITIDSDGRVTAASSSTVSGGGGGGGASTLTGLTDVTTTYTLGKLLIADGAKFNGVVLSGDATISSTGVIDLQASVVGANEISSTTVNPASYVLANITIDGDGRITAASSNTIATGVTSLTGLNDVGTAATTAGRLLIADGTKYQSVALSGDASITSAGVIDLGASVVGANEISSTAVTPGTYEPAKITVDGDGRLTAASSSTTNLLCHSFENLVAADDAMLFMIADAAVTVNSVGCRTSGFTTQPTITFEDDSANALTGSPICNATVTQPFTVVTSGGSLSALEALRFNTTNTTAPLIGTQTDLCVTYTRN